MKRSLIALSFLIFALFIGNWAIRTPESLPQKDSYIHSLKRKIFHTLLGMKKDFYSNNHVPLCKDKIDIVILASEQDLITLPHTIDAANGLVMHPINKIYVVSTDSKKIKDIATSKNAEFIDIDKILPNTLQKQKYEIIKLAADSFTQSDYYLVIHANTILLQTQIFLRSNKSVLFATMDYSIENKSSIDSIFKFGQYYNLSFTGPIMFFDKMKLKALKNHLEKLHNKPWLEIINIENFYAFEAYASFVLTIFPEETVITCDRNVHIPASNANGVEWQRGFLSRTYKSLTFHRTLS